MIELEKKTSADWHKEIYTEYIIIDPDGWDRINFDYSFYKELITSDEFIYRIMRSTLISNSIKTTTMKLKKGLKVIHKFNGRITTVNEWDDVGLMKSDKEYDMFHGSYRKYTWWDKIGNLFIKYFCLLLIMISFLSCEKPKERIDEYKGWLVIEKSSYFGYEFVITDGSSEKYVRTYELYFSQYDIGDTIK
jgi:hypothetical protein